MGSVSASQLAITFLGLLVLTGCASDVSAPPVHSEAYYAARIKAPVLPPVTAVVSPARSSAAAPRPVLHIVVSTTRHLLRVYEGDTVLATYHVAIGFNGSSPRRIRGDDVTPVGHYRIGWILHGTRYGPFMGLNYPNKRNAEWGLRRGLINQRQYHAIVAAIDSGKTPPQNTPLGGEIGIHGMGPQFADAPDSKVFPGRWTAGCVALSNWDAQKIVSMVTVGTPVEIVGEVSGYHRNLHPEAQTQLREVRFQDQNLDARLRKSNYIVGTNKFSAKIASELTTDTVGVDSSPDPTDTP